MESTVTAQRNDGFICGVVEGFYGRPWTTEQRKDLFLKMKKWKMSSYLYAPKDDYKHRAFWRELYTVEEVDHLSGLISAARECGISFIYAISPGLDIGYSNAKDIAALKRKLDQVSQMGCHAFAVLFDDIDPEMSKEDKEVFKSFGHAQVSVANEVFQHINATTFLFCPTQYCATRAVPTVSTSEYLKTIGSKLDLKIDIMWTGSRVISKELTIESIEEVTEVMRRPPVIWDNLHANDYDQKRIFLGPYSGRSPQLIPRLRGVLTNPNCEYGSNFVAIHTLAQWSKCSVDAKKKIEETMNADAKLETEDSGDGSHIPENVDPHIYHPAIALKAALQDWLLEFKRNKSAWGPIIKPQIQIAPVPIPVPLLPSINTCMSLTTPTTTSIPPLPFVPTAVTVQGNPGNGFAQTIACATPVMNSLVSDNKIICADSVQSANMSTSSSPVPPNGLRPSSPMNVKAEVENSLVVHVHQTHGLEPMDVATPPNPSPPEPSVLESRSAEDILMLEREENDRSGMSTPDEGIESPNVSLSGMNEDTDVKVGSNPPTQANTPSSTMQVEHQEFLENDAADELSVDDLQLLCDLFYLPFEHGVQGLHVLNEFQWLKVNANLVAGISMKDKEKPEVAEWFDRALKFDEFTQDLNRLVTKLNLVNNRELLYELYPYIWDMRGVVSLLNSYVKWLALEQIPSNVTSFVHGSFTWFSKGWREAFMSGDQEPWVIRGGLTAELQRLIPVDRGTDLYVYKSPAVPNSQTYTIRPYRASDEEAVYKVCLATFKDGLNSADDFIDIPQFPGDIKIGGFMTCGAELNFVVEDENDTVIGIAVGVLNGKEMRRKINVSWIPAMTEKYSLKAFESSPFAKKYAEVLHTGLPEVSDDVCANHPAELRMAIMAPLVDPSVPKRLLTCILAALRANGVFGCYTEVPLHDKYFTEFYKNLGFVESSPTFLIRNF